MRTLRYTLVVGVAVSMALASISYGAEPAATPVLTSLYSFKGGPADGASPASAVIVADGLLVGTTTSGGVGCSPYGCGTVFSLTPPASEGGAWTEAVLHSFTGASGDGSSPTSIVKGAGGVLYGTTAGGGVSAGCPSASGCGTVFSLTPPASPGGSWTETVLHSFAGPPNDGYLAKGLAVGSGGVLYGTTFFGGASSCTFGCGTVFSLTPPTSPEGLWTETVLHSFPGSTYDGYFPLAGVVIGGGGVLYGTTGSGGEGSGTVYELIPPSSPGGMWNETVLHNFGAQYDGTDVQSGVAVGSGGVLYGTTVDGGLGGLGTVFSLTPPESAGGPWTEAVLYSFSGASFPYNPEAGLAIGTTGVLYGTTPSGGVLQWGTVFALRPPSSSGGSWTETTLHNFRGGDGSLPSTAVTLTANGMLYGTTLDGGTSNFGTVFSLKP